MDDATLLSPDTLTAVDPEQCAREAGLHYLEGEPEGIRRQRSGRGFRYTTAQGTPVRDRATLERIRSLAIPPAWVDVWISRDPRSHLQATGFDARGRKQYRYHPGFRQAREAVKFAGLGRLATLLPRLRARVARSLSVADSDRERVLAALVRILDATGIRIGNEEYTRSNGSHGLTTLRPQHARLRGSSLTLCFRGKSKQRQRLTVHDGAVAALVRSCRGRLPARLFAWIDDDGRAHPVRAGDVNDYLQRIVGVHLTAKEIRTWLATVHALDELHHNPSLREAIAVVANRMGHTPTVCRRSYIHPAVLQAHADGTLDDLLQRARRTPHRHLSVPERAVALLLAPRPTRRQRAA